MDAEKLKKIIWIPPLIIGIAIIFAFWIHGYYMANRNDDVITVTGSAKRTVDADLGKWTANFSRRASLGNLKETLAEANADTIAIRKFIMEQGFSEASIRFLPLSTDPVYEATMGYVSNPPVVGYMIRQEVRVEDRDIAKIDQFSKAATKLIDRGIVPEYQRTEYFYTGIDRLRPELYAEATKDALTRAKAIVGGTGSSVGSLKSARTGVIQILSPNSTDVSDYGAYDLSTKVKDVSATVNVSFELK